MKLADVRALTFDVFGTILDLTGSLSPFIDDFLKRKRVNMAAAEFWFQWRSRQRIEQYQDNILLLGHSGYLETSRRAFVYTLRLNAIEASDREITDFMQVWRQLSPFPDVIPALERLKTKYSLVVLSNGDPEFLDHLVKNRISWKFDDVISVHKAGFFKPHPAVYRKAAALLGLEVCQCLMVSSNSFDVLGARASGFQSIFVNRYGMPYEDSPFLPQATTKDFAELADLLL